MIEFLKSREHWANISEFVIAEVIFTVLGIATLKGIGLYKRHKKTIGAAFMRAARFGFEIVIPLIMLALYLGLKHKVINWIAWFELGLVLSLRSVFAVISFAIDAFITIVDALAAKASGVPFNIPAKRRIFVLASLWWQLGSSVLVAWLAIYWMCIYR